MSCVLVPETSVLDTQHGIYEATDEEKDWRPNSRSKAITAVSKSGCEIHVLRVNRPCLGVEDCLQFR